MSQGGYFAEAAEATSSKVTLEELRMRKVELKENDMEFVAIAHRSELRELFYMLHRQERLEVEGSPAVPPPDDLFHVEEEDADYQAFLGEYALASMILNDPEREVNRSPVCTCQR
ncbi:hypothetical protein CBS101457_002549 [Exobasidium rhododendri]|nr:hypothetical protein CBS101457_002549 [Exobasidium rhododendri]